MLCSLQCNLHQSISCQLIKNRLNYHILDSFFQTECIRLRGQLSADLELYFFFFHQQCFIFLTLNFNFLFFLYLSYQHNYCLLFFPHFFHILSKLLSSIKQKQLQITRRSFFAFFQQVIWFTLFIKILMKKILVIAGFLGISTAANIGVYIEAAQGGKQYKLGCNNAKGGVKYAITNLPQGVQFRNGDTLFLAGSPKAGKFNINVRAEDESGQNIDQVITLEIASNSSISNGQNQNIKISNTESVISKTASNGKLGKIISTYSSTEIKRPDYSNSNKYPQIEFPKGSLPESVNPTVIKIFTEQAQKSASNRNTITSQDLGLSIVSTRYQNAIKGITNLLKIIDQARANRNKAQSQIQVYTQSYNEAVTLQRNSQNAIIGLQTKSSQIISAINSLIALVQDLRNKINQTITQRQSLNKEKNASLAIVADLQNQKAALIDKLKGLDGELAANVKILSDKGAQSQSANEAVSSKEKQLASNQKDLQNTNIARTGAISDIEEKNKVVQSLRKKLEEAERDLSYAKIKLSDIDAIRKVLPGKIADIQKQLEDLRIKAQVSASDLARIQALIDNLKGNKYPELTKTINDLDAKISSQRTKVSDLDSQLAASQGPLQDFKAKLDQAQEDLNFVRNEKADIDENLRLAYQNGNDANNRVGFAKQNLDAIIKRFRQESKIVSDATLNLQRARAQQALAKIALDQFVAHYSDALPYVIVPHGNQVGMGTPWGNNPSGAALGPLKKDGNGAPGSFKINSWVNYLSSAYGAGVSPAFSGSVTELYPFSFSSKVQGNNVYNEGGAGGEKTQKISCGSNKNENLKIASGVVTAIRDDGFDVKIDDGSVYKINVAPCTNLNANTPGYKIQKGDEAIVKGSSTQKGVISASQITCLDEN